MSSRILLGTVSWIATQRRARGSRVLLSRLASPARVSSLVRTRPRLPSPSAHPSPSIFSRTIRSVPRRRRALAASGARSLSASAPRSAAAVARVISRDASLASARAAFEPFPRDGSSTNRRATRSATQNTRASRPSRASASDSRRATESESETEAETETETFASPGAAAAPMTVSAFLFSSWFVFSTTSSTTRRTARAHEARSGAATAKEASAAARSATRAFVRDSGRSARRNASTMASAASRAVTRRTSEMFVVSASRAAAMAWTARVA